ncbi:ankyrin repeat and EF-hand domain-containing protein 1 isoform X1 [Denticeps clupeoides]|uniref:ankyrin repeat and EF-hand domain-containing protein 1 isoform X1 n=1 Tax=Denticeps clupeoides TaxID=299321 RepID=UPI0010A340FD|nr:ankyrin repeat and EF-hand domain-containing protein 1-like isoform X1 [Denticeps clupeoides]XP_028826686.1 ankyrin repeat and EF-hand domain-containing protein 1-like isoform X1 [Denticeps clupeoides]XP_028826693.1 ankyrin repeat and EF-hand domain-containing protein 1-like isoform X1 [Denticeps clupeoides]
MKSAVAASRLELQEVYKLLQLVREGNKTQIKRLVCVGVPDLINLTEPKEGKSAMHLASESNDADTVKFLLSLGARVNIQDKRGRTPVLVAAELGHDGMVALLAENQADMNLPDNEGKGVLFYCVCPTKQHMRCLQTALDGRADVNGVSAAGKPVFLSACENARNCESMCISILERGADPCAVNEVTGHSALMEAAKAGAAGLVRAILKQGGDPNVLDKKRMHAAHFAAEGGFFEVLRTLSAYSANLGAMASDGNTPLHFAAAGGFSECCRFIFQRGCDPKLKNLNGKLPRQIAKDKGHHATLKELKKAERLHAKFSKQNAVNPNELWALTLHDWSSEHESDLRTAFANAEKIPNPLQVARDNFVSVLQAHRAPIEDDNLQKIILKHDENREGVIDINDFFKGLKYLQKAYVLSSYAPKKNKVSKQRKGKKKGKFTLTMPICTVPPELVLRQEDGGLPLFMIEGYQEFTDHKRFDWDQPPVHPIEDDSAWYISEPEKIFININYCVKTTDLDSLSLAFAKQVPVDVTDKFYKTPLMTACSSGNLEVARYLISLGADVNAGDQFRWTPLHHACYAGQVDVIRLLVQSGAALETVTVSGLTPLMRAIESCRPSCVDYLIKSGARVQAENKKGQNCLDIAKVYGDPRVIDLVKARFESLPKLTDNKKGKERKLLVNSKPSSPSPTKEKAPSLAPDAALTKETPKYFNTKVTGGNADRLDISYMDRTVSFSHPRNSVIFSARLFCLTRSLLICAFKIWGKQAHTRQLTENKEFGRDRHFQEEESED